jgi:type IV pilus assembly protein PilE
VNKKAFTLIELLIVVALIGILTSIGVITFQGQIKASKQKKAEINLNSVNLALQEYKSNNGDYGSSTTCSSNSNSTIDSDLFDNVQNLRGDETFQYCITVSGSNFTIMAKNPKTNCQITLNQNLAVNRNSSC